jgi:uncharacterized Zn finger protein (UPF0148 family)
MTRRVFLELGESTTGTHCGDCDAKSVDQLEGTVFCPYGVFGRYEKPFVVRDTARHDACRANEVLESP